MWGNRHPPVSSSRTDALFRADFRFFRERTRDEPPAPRPHSSHQYISPRNEAVSVCGLSTRRTLTPASSVPGHCGKEADGCEKAGGGTPFPRLLYPLLPVQSSAAPRGLGSAHEQITLITSRVCAHFKEENSEAPKTQRHPDITEGQPGSERLCSGRAAVCALSGPGLTPTPARQPWAPGLYSLKSDRVEGCRSREG